MPGRTEEHHCDLEAGLSKSRPRFERNSPEFNLEALLCKPSCPAAMSHQFLLTRQWLMFKRCASYPFRNLCTCCSCSRRDAIPFSCSQMYPPPRNRPSHLSLIISYTLFFFVSNFLFPFFRCSFLHYFLLFHFFFLLRVLLKGFVSC